MLHNNAIRLADDLIIGQNNNILYVITIGVGPY